MSESLNNMNDELDKARSSFDSLAGYVNSLNQSAGEAEETFRDIARDLADAAKNGGDFSSAFKIASNDTSKIATQLANIKNLTKEELKTQKGRNDLTKKLNKLSKEKIKLETSIKILTEKRLSSTEQEAENIDKVIEKLQDSLSTINNIKGEYKEIDDTIKSINKNTNFVEKLAKGISQIPGIGPLLAGPLKSLSEGIAEYQVGIDKSLKGKKKLAAQGERLKKSTDALAKGGILLMVKSLFDADKLTTDFSKQLGVSKDTAKEIKREFTAIAVSSGKAYLQTSNLVKAQMELGDTLGAVSGFTNEQVTNQVTLTKQLGLSSQEAAGIAKFSILNNKSSRDQTEEILDQVVGLQKQTGIQLDGRKIVKEVASINGALGAQYGYNTKELAKAAVAANKIGLELKQTESIANSLLNFETSISNELEAELMIGRELNFEKARELALQGKSAEAAVEVAKNFGSQAEFLKLNVKQREALAQAAGVDSNALSDQIAKQEVLKKLGAESIQQALDGKMTRDEIIAKGGEELLLQYEQQSAADKFADAMTKIKETLGSSAENLIPLIEGLANMANSAGLVYGTLGLIGAISLVRTISSIVTMVAGLTTAGIASASLASALTFGLGAVAIIAGTAAIVGMMTKETSKAKSNAKSIGDGAFGADGSIQISTKEGGLFEPSPNDDVVIFPGAIDKMNQPNPTSPTGNVDQSQLIAEVRKQNDILMRILQKDTNIEIDGTILNKKVQQSLSPLG